jgi:branched-chain amino acid transport system substrate-binding protein
MAISNVPRSRTLAFTALIGSAALVLAGCAPATDGGADGADADLPVVKIGYIGPLSGGSASLGVPSLNAMELAVADLNEDGDLGFTLELVSADDEADAAKSSTAAQRMVTEDGVVLVMGGPNSAPVKANNAIITGAGVPNVISIAQSDALVDPANPGFDLTYRVTENNSYDVGAIVSLFVDGDYDKICMVADTSEYGQNGIAATQAVFADNDLELASIAQHDANATDLTPQVLQLRDADCDAVYLYTLGPDAALFMKTVNQVGWEVPVIGARALAQQAFISIAGKDGDGIIFPSVIDPDKQSAQDFIAEYDAEYGADSDPAHVFSAVAYDTVQMVAAALKATEGEGGEALATALQSVEIEGVSGKDGSKLSWSADKHEAPSEDFLTFWTIKNGKYEFYSNDVTTGN